jgi:hypothetical protein
MFAPPLPATLPNIRSHAQRLVEIETRLEELALSNKELIAERNHLRQVELPRMLQELELTSIGVGNHVVELQTQIEASLPKDPAKRLAALTWLIANGHGGTVKRLLTLDLPKNNDALVEQAVDVLEAISLTPTVDYTVHHASYKALCREIVRSGQPAPLDDLGVFVGKIAEVKL